MGNLHTWPFLDFFVRMVGVSRVLHNWIIPGLLLIRVCEVGGMK